MARAVPLSTLITRVRRRADIESATARFPDAEITDNINESITELYDVILAAYGQDYYRSTYSVTLSAGLSTYALPATFMQLISVDIAFLGAGSYVATLAPYMESERNDFKFLAGLGTTPTYYRLVGQNINFIPAPAGAFTATINFIPTPPILVNPGDTFDGINGWEEYVVLDAAIKCCLKDEATDVAMALESRKAVIAQRIKDRATERDAGQPERVHDVTGYGNPWASRWDD